MSAVPQSTAPVRWASALAAMYLFSLAAAFFWSYLPRHFVSAGWTSSAIGLVLGAATLVRIITMPLLARIAERTSSTTRVVQIVSTVGALGLWFLPFVTSSWAVYLTFVVVSATWNSFLPLADSLTVRQLGSASYGRIRAWGSVGFALAAIAIAWFGATREHVVVAGWSTWLIAILGTIGVVATWAFPRDEVAIRAPNLRESLRLLRRPALLWCLPLWALHWATQAPFNLFLVFLAEDRGMGGWVPGVATAVGVAAEVLVLWLGRRWLDRVGPEAAFAVAAVFTALRWGLSAVVTVDLLLVAIQLLHGLTFGVFLLAAMAVLDREIEGSVRDSGQAALYVIVFGAGSALGNAAAGWLDEYYGAAAAFGGAAALEVVVALGALGYWASVVRRRVDER